MSRVAKIVMGIEKIAKIATIAIIISLVVILFVFLNLSSNSVYYVKNMPNSLGKDAQIMMFIDNMEYVTRPENNWVKYDHDGTNTMSIESGTQRIYFGNGYGENHHQYTYNIDNDKYYEFDHRFNLIYAAYDKPDNKEMILIDEIDQEEVKRDIYNVLDYFIREADTKPIINLQWIFNFIYKDDFK